MPERLTSQALADAIIALANRARGAGRPDVEAMLCILTGSIRAGQTRALWDLMHPFAVEMAALLGQRDG